MVQIYKNLIAFPWIVIGFQGVAFLHSTGRSKWRHRAGGPKGSPDGAQDLSSLIQGPRVLDVMGVPWGSKMISEGWDSVGIPWLVGGWPTWLMVINVG